MKHKIFMFAAAFICCLFVSRTASAGETLSYRKCGNCEIIVKHSTNWLGGSWTTYGLAKNGVTMVSPECDVLTYNEELHILVLRDIASHAASQYHIYLYNTDTGKCVYSGRYNARCNRVPYLTFKKKGKYTEAVVHYFCDYSGDLTETVGSFFTKDGKLYQVATKQVSYEAPVE